MKEHQYQVSIKWTGNQGEGTAAYKAYSRDYSISAKDKANPILGSSDPSFLGDKTRYNPEDLLVASASSCHMLWYLHLCSVHKIIVVDYEDHAEGIMEETATGTGAFKEIILNPVVTISALEDVEKAKELHHEANNMCFIANSCNFSIKHKAKIVV
ncbi:OsmC family protein [Aquimarina hainanensis]|mgnify:CR=1 FL=1|uniref:OsmC family protein n=1 Tax=Aquimarina hainanensis TaxID=1578017 RepID=A0ABW5NFC5_9FLAO|nr:OsmC family protein [Aquimarina sp. TRL1]QKX06620.1 OsmC family peroxiredoxin [Aquimarina sp. TRL1]